MNTFTRSASIITFAAAMTVFGASFAAASPNGGSPGGPGPNGDGRGSAGNSTSAPEHANPFPKTNVIQIGGNNRWYPRRVRDTNQHPCEHLYFAINRTNSLVTVPQYRECLRLNGEY